MAFNGIAKKWSWREFFFKEAMLGGKWELYNKLLKYFKSQVSSIKATLEKPVMWVPSQATCYRYQEPGWTVTCWHGLPGTMNFCSHNFYKVILTKTKNRKYYSMCKLILFWLLSKLIFKWEKVGSRPLSQYAFIHVHTREWEGRECTVQWVKSQLNCDSDKLKSILTEHRLRQCLCPSYGDGCPDTWWPCWDRCQTSAMFNGIENETLISNKL